MSAKGSVSGFYRIYGFYRSLFCRIYEIYGIFRGIWVLCESMDFAGHMRSTRPVVSTGSIGFTGFMGKIRSMGSIMRIYGFYTDLWVLYDLWDR